MRWVIVVIGALMLAAGVVAGVVYPRLMQGEPGPELARWQALDGEGRFQAGPANLTPPAGAAILTAALLVDGPLPVVPQRRVLTVVVIDEFADRVAAATFGFEAPGALQSPQTGVMRYRETVPLPVVRSGPHQFVPEAGPDFPAGALGVEMVLNAAQHAVDPLLRPVGIGLVVLGAVAMLLGLRRRRENPNAQPPPRWGRR